MTPVNFGTFDSRSLPSEWMSTDKKPTGKRKREESSEDSLSSSSSSHEPPAKKLHTPVPTNLLKVSFPKPSQPNKVKLEGRRLRSQGLSAFAAPVRPISPSKPSKPASKKPLSIPAVKVQQMASSHLSLMHEWVKSKSKPPREVFQPQAVLFKSKTSSLFKAASVASEKPTVVKVNTPPLSLPTSHSKIAKNKKSLAKEVAASSVSSKDHEKAKKKFSEKSLKLARKINEFQQARLKAMQQSYKAAQVEAANIAKVQGVPHAIQSLGSATLGPFVHAAKMEVLPRDLSALIQERQKSGVLGLSMKETKAFAKSGFEFFQKMQEKHLLHTDIKPANIAFDPETLTTKFFDFEGLYSTKTGRSADRTTLPYRPLEFIINKKTSSSFDVWSFGVTLYYCYTGKRLFYWDDPEAMQLVYANRAETDIVAAILSLTGKVPLSILQGPNAEKFFHPDTYKLKVPPTEHIILPTWTTVERDLREAAKAKNEPVEQALALLDLLKQMLVNKDRISPTDALTHPFFAVRKEESKEPR